MASSSASEGSEAEDLEKFAAITDIVDSEVVKFNGSSHLPAKSKPSLRHWREDEDIASSTTELITPEFRQHVAKKLSKFLDKNYICTQDVEHLQNGHDNCSHDSGIRLLLSSNHMLLEESSSTVVKKKILSISSSGESDTDDEELNRLAEAAVSGYSIIQTGGHNSSREQVEDETVQTNGVKRKKEKKRKNEKRKSTQVDEETKEKKHKKHKKEKYKEKTRGSQPS